MKTLLLFLALANIIAAAPLKRADVTAITYGPAVYKAASLRDVLLDAQNIAAAKGITLTADAAALQDAATKTITLDVEGLNPRWPSRIRNPRDWDGLEFRRWPDHGLFISRCAGEIQKTQRLNDPQKSQPNYDPQHCL